MRRRPHAGFLVAASFAAGSLALVPVPVGPAAASGPVCMGVFIDDGNGSAPTTQAAQVAPGTSDLDAMSSDGDSVTQNNAGLVCAINNYPANGLQNCLGTSGSLYYYWSYWEGDPYTNTWTYANVGPAEHTVGAGQTYVAGWRYQDPGADNPTATKPSVTPAAAFAQACPGVAPVAPSSGGGGGSSGSGSSSGGATSNTSANTSPPAAVPSTQPAGVAPSAPAPAGSGRSQPVPATKTTPSSGTNKSSVPSSGTTSSTTTTTSDTGSSKPAPPRTAKLALKSTAHRGASGGDSALPIVLVALLIGLIGAAAWFRWRRRPAEE